MARMSLAALGLVLAVAATGCGSGTAPVELEGGTAATAGKALTFIASTDKTLGSEKGGVYAIELRGVDANAGDRASFDKPDYVDKSRCIAEPCEWTVVPKSAANYEFKAFLIDLRNNKEAGGSNPVELDWKAPPRPKGITLYVNGTTPATTPLDADDYTEFPVGQLQVEAKWTTDARDTGYYVRLSMGDQVYARCTVGTSCRVRKKFPLGLEEEMSWTVQLMTTRGNKVADGFKVCLEGAAESKPA
jgi:hypothetical protein